MEDRLHYNQITQDRKIKPENQYTDKLYRSIRMTDPLKEESLGEAPIVSESEKYMKWGMPDIQTGFKKGRETRDHTANIPWLSKCTNKFQKKISAF